MKKRFFIMAGTILLVLLCNYVAADNGNAGIYDLNGNLLVPYRTLVYKYHFNVSKDYESPYEGGFSKVLDRLGINEDIVLVLPEIKKIGEGAFFFAENLAYIELPDSLEEIGSCAFYGTGLHEISIPSSISVINNNTFDSCSLLSSVELSKGLSVIDTSAFRHTPELTDISIPGTVHTIGNCAFQDAGFDYMYIPDSVVNIGADAFENVDTVCYNGNAETFNGFGAKNFHKYSSCNTCDLCGATVKYVPYIIKEAEFINDGVCNIPEHFERNGISYENVMVAMGAYEDNEDIVKLIIPDTLVNIGDNAFKDCNNLQQVELHDNLVYLGNGAFANCRSLEKLIIPEDINYINGCVSGCTNLREIYLPNKISLDIFDFVGCDSLQKVYYSGTAEEWSNIPVGAPAPIMQSTIDRVFDDDVDIVFLKNEQ